MKKTNRFDMIAYVLQCLIEKSPNIPDNFIGLGSK